MNERFELQEVEREDRCAVYDKETGITCLWKKGNFNNTQEFVGTVKAGTTAQELARAMRELGDWLVENHRDLV